MFREFLNIATDEKFSCKDNMSNDQVFYSECNYLIRSHKYGFKKILAKILNSMSNNFLEQVSNFNYLEKIDMTYTC